MRSSTSRILISLIVALLILSPLAEGVASGSQGIFQIAGITLGIAALLGAAGTLRSLRSSQRDTRFVRMIVGLVSTSVSLTALDLVARLLFPFGLPPIPETHILHRWPAMPSVSRYTPNVHFEGQLFGALAMMNRNPEHRIMRYVSFSTDEYGFFNPDAASETVDIILLGDSFGTGYGTDYPDTWGALLEDDYGVELYNLSTSNSSPWQEYVNYLVESERIVTTPQTVLVWALFSGNDLDEPFANAFTRQELPWSSWREAAAVFWNNYMVRSPFGIALARFANQTEMSIVDEAQARDGSLLLLYKPYELTSQRSLEEVRRHENYPRLEQTIKAMHELTQRRNIRLVIVVIPTKEELFAASRIDPEGQHRTGFSLAIELMSNEEHIPFLDLRPTFMNASPTAAEDFFWRDDTHWNPVGHRLAAQTVVAFLCAQPLHFPSRDCSLY